MPLPPKGEFKAYQFDYDRFMKNIFMLQTTLPLAYGLGGLMVSILF